MTVKLTPWYLVRHAPVAAVRKGIYAEADGAANLPNLSHVKALANSLPDEALWYVSPLRRTRQTADALRKQMTKPGEMAIIGSLREQNFGDWQGLSFEQIWQEIKELPVHNWSLLAGGTPPPGGESFEALYTRVGDFLEENMAVQTERPRVLVTHAGVIRALIGTMLGLTAEKALSLGSEVFSVSKLLHQSGQGQGGAWRLEFLNRIYL